jgi:hypothetical protein
MKDKIVHLVHNPFIFYLSSPWHRGDRRLATLPVKVRHCAEDDENTGLVPAATEEVEKAVTTTTSSEKGGACHSMMLRGL